MIEFKGYVMKKHFLSLLLLHLIIIFIGSSILKIDAFGSEAEDNLKGKNRTGCVEIIEAKSGTPSCTTADSLSIQLKVNCDAPIDIQVFYKGMYKGRKVWLAKTFMNKKQGDKVTLTECDASGPYLVSKRKAGSNEPFPTP
jgi:hypothetical protein